MRRLSGVKAAILIGVLLCATRVFATPVTIEELGVDPGQVINAHLSNFYSGSVYAGTYGITVDGVLTNSYCIEFLQFSSSGPTGYDLMGLPNDPKYREAAWIMQQYDPNKPGTSADNLVNAQVAIWEIMSADPGSLRSGDLYVRAWSGYGSREGAQAIVDQVLGLYGQGYFNSFDTSGFMLAHNESFQDYILKSGSIVDPQENPVPEPSTVFLLGGGLIAFLGMGRNLIPKRPF